MIRQTKSIELGLNFSPEEIAEMFCKMDNVDMAKFFNEVGRQFSSFHDFEVQIAQTQDTRELTELGKKVMKCIGEFPDQVSELSEIEWENPSILYEDFKGWNAEMLNFFINNHQNKEIQQYKGIYTGEEILGLLKTDYKDCEDGYIDISSSNCNNFKPTSFLTCKTIILHSEAITQLLKAKV